MTNQFILAVLKGALYEIKRTTTKAAVLAEIVSGIERCSDEPIPLVLSAMQDRIVEAIESSRLKAPMKAQIETEIWAIEAAIEEAKQAITNEETPMTTINTIANTFTISSLFGGLDIGEMFKHGEYVYTKIAFHNGANCSPVENVIRTDYASFISDDDHVYITPAQLVDNWSEEWIVNSDVATLVAMGAHLLAEEEDNNGFNGFSAALSQYRFDETVAEIQADIIAAASN